MDAHRSSLLHLLLAAVLAALLLAPVGASAQGEATAATSAGTKERAGAAKQRLRRVARRDGRCRGQLRRIRNVTARPAAKRRRLRRVRSRCVRLRAAHRRARRRAIRQRLIRLRRKARQRHAVADQVVVSEQAASSSETPGIIFRGDFEEGFDPWHVQSLDYRATLAPGVQGVRAGRFEVHDGDVEPETGSQRSEVSGPTFDEGQDLYIRDAIRVTGSNSFEGPWQIVQQLHEVDWGGSPGMAVFLDEDDVLSIGSGDGSEVFWEGEELQRDRWYDLVYRVYLSRDSGAGFIEVWLDGAQQRLDGGETRSYGQTIQTPQTYLKAGIYRSRSSSGTSIVEHDAILVGTSYAAVAAG